MVIQVVKKCPFFYRNHKSLPVDRNAPLDPILRKVNPPHTFTPHFFKIDFIVTGCLKSITFKCWNCRNMVEISITKQRHGKHITPATNMLEAECHGTKKSMN
jgi:hypothetical protein